ncbi:MAG: pyrroline-5-carboxylate reductase [Spirochaetaceae bacterium]|jgi:pyrroline-5-carboxylate reductase|nr:pyrroline-5-carboxylate reductase [Spirochaetaceae bacterium]
MIISFIGCGNMGGALVRSMAANAEDSSIEKILLADTDTAKAESLAKELGHLAEVRSNADAAVADIVFLAVKPQTLNTLLPEIAGRLPTYTRVVSMAAGWTIARLQELLSHQSVVRIMPNTPALISKGVIAMCYSETVPKAQMASVASLLKFAGIVEQVPEEMMDAVTGLSGSGPAFVYIFIEALADAGVKAGLPRETALKLAAKTVEGSATMVLQTGHHPGLLKDMVTSPGGTTIAGVAALEAHAFRAAAMSAVDAAYEKSKAMTT